MLTVDFRASNKKSDMMASLRSGAYVPVNQDLHNFALNLEKKQLSKKRVVFQRFLKKLNSVIASDNSLSEPLQISFDWNSYIVKIKDLNHTNSQCLVNHLNYELAAKSPFSQLPESELFEISIWQSFSKSNSSWNIQVQLFDEYMMLVDVTN